MDREAKIFKALSDPLRLKLAVLLAQGDEICVCKLTEALNEPQFKVSRHLGILRNAGLVEARRQGTWMHYRLSETNTKLDKGLHQCFQELMEAQPPIPRENEQTKASLGC